MKNKAILLLPLAVFSFAIYAEGARIELVRKTLDDLESSCYLNSIDDVQFNIGTIEFYVRTDDDGTKVCNVGFSGDDKNLVSINVEQKSKISYDIISSFIKEEKRDDGKKGREMKTLIRMDRDPSKRNGMRYKFLDSHQFCELDELGYEDYNTEYGDCYELTIKKSETSRVEEDDLFCGIPFSKEFIEAATIKGLEWFYNQFPKRNEQPLVFGHSKKDAESYAIMSPWGGDRLLLVCKKCRDIESVILIVRTDEENFIAWNAVKRNGNVSWIEYSSREKFFWLDADGDGLAESVVEFAGGNLSKVYDTIVEKEHIERYRGDDDDNDIDKCDI